MRARARERDRGSIEGSLSFSFSYVFKTPYAAAGPRPGPLLFLAGGGPGGGGPVGLQRGRRRFFFFFFRLFFFGGELRKKKKKKLLPHLNPSSPDCALPPGKFPPSRRRSRVQDRAPSPPASQLAGKRAAGIGFFRFGERSALHPCHVLAMLFFRFPPSFILTCRPSPRRDP